MIIVGTGQAGLGIGQFADSFQKKENQNKKLHKVSNYGELLGNGIEEKLGVENAGNIGKWTYTVFSITTSLSRTVLGLADGSKFEMHKLEDS